MFGQKFIKVLPVVVSLFVVLLSAHANRYTFLIGAVNSVIYSVGYIMERLYASVASALLLSFPIQIVSFVLWKKRRLPQNVAQYPHDSAPKLSVARAAFCRAVGRVFLAVFGGGLE